VPVVIPDCRCCEASMARQHTSTARRWSLFAVCIRRATARIRKQTANAEIAARTNRTFRVGSAKISKTNPFPTAHAGKNIMATFRAVLNRILSNSESVMTTRFPDLLPTLPDQRQLWPATCENLQESRASDFPAIIGLKESECI